jgi:hypothetical protein
MAELGTAVGVVFLGVQVMQGFFNFYQNYRSYLNDIDRLCCSISGVSKTLEALKRRLEYGNISDRSAANVGSSIAECHDALLSLKKKLEKVEKQPCPNTEDTAVLDTSKTRSLDQFRKLGYPFRKGTIVNLEDYVNELKGSLTLGIQDLSL